MVAFGYVRKSRMDDDSKTQSPAVQADAIRELAATLGDDPVIVEDLDVSGGKPMAERPGMARILAAMADGTAHRLYAYDQSRLARDVVQVQLLWQEADQRGIDIRLVRGNIEGNDAAAEMLRGVQGLTDQFYRKQTSEKIRASLARKRAKHAEDHGPDCACGERQGGRFYEDTATVKQAFKDAGRVYTKAARLLNERNVPTRNDGSVWHATSVRSIIKRAAPELMPPTEIRGSKATQPRPARFARLLRCSIDGSLLTPSWDDGTKRMRYYCHAGSVTPHGRKTIGEEKLMPQFSAWLLRTSGTMRRVQQGDPKDQEKRAKLAERRRRLGVLFEMGEIEETDLTDRLAAIQAEEKKLGVLRSLVHVELPEHVDDDAAKVNEYLTRVFDHVVVDMSGAEGRGGEPEMTPVPRDASVFALDKLFTGSPGKRRVPLTEEQKAEARTVRSSRRER